MIKEDYTLKSLLELDGIRFIVDEQLGLWVKFEVNSIKQTKERPSGIKYSVSLHNRFNDRILGFDNAHPIEYKKNLKKQTYDHWHANYFDEIKPYYCENAAKLLEDFWREADKIIQILKEEIYVKT